MKPATFRRFSTIEERDAVADLLEMHGIQSIKKGNAPLLDSNFIGQNFDNAFILQLSPADFTKANEVLQTAAQALLNEVEDDYYLLSFTNEELLDVVRNQDEWGEFDYVLALKLLGERGVSLSSENMDSIQKMRYEKLTKPVATPVAWLIASYLAVICSPILLRYAVIYWIPMVAIVSALYILFGKKTLPDGQKIYPYTQQTRTHAIIIILLGVLFYVYYLFLLFSNSVYDASPL
ncbi:hypothetical protein LX64_03659 [Chitinophaga skermanii]|uniref:Uncharacterized protein n=1 Tax=Chitinophaga skermanii TaxID=331697 RepID=A0A327QDJ9_9BACT|nr:hypothetical protein [Chitinophaga skermanii]RAJ02639.1 hypothetical protein LX64_03659 [Chitinophaga skermanii]